MRWEKTAGGRPMPLDPAPVPDGNLMLRDGLVAFLPAYAETDEPRYKSHFATCPSGDQWRK